MRTVWRTLGPATTRPILVISCSVLVIGVSYGAAAQSAGLAWWQLTLLAVAVLAGSAEFVFVGIIAAGGAPLLAALAGLLVNARHIAYSLSVARLLGRGRGRFLGAHLINDESVAVALRERDPRRARTALLLCGAGVALCWPLGALIGMWLGQVVASPAQLGLDAAFPALLIAIALPALRNGTTAATAALGGAVAVAAAPFVPAGVPILLALLALLLPLLRRRRQQRLGGVIR